MMRGTQASACRPTPPPESLSKKAATSSDKLTTQFRGLWTHPSPQKHCDNLANKNLWKIRENDNLPRCICSMLLVFSYSLLKHIWKQQKQANKQSNNQTKNQKKRTNQTGRHRDRETETQKDRERFVLLHAAIHHHSGPQFQRQDTKCSLVQGDESLNLAISEREQNKVVSNSRQNHNSHEFEGKSQGAQTEGR